MKTIKLLPVFFAATMVLNSCSNDDDDPIPVNEEEVITDVSITLTDDTGASTTYTYTDPEYREAGYVDPIIELSSDMTYIANLNFYNNSDPDNPEVITEEIIEEKDDHFIQYAFQGVNITLARADDDTTDSNGIKIGLKTIWVAGADSDGSVTITLIHQAETKDTTDPNGSHTGGETDAQVTFAAAIQ